MFNAKNKSRENVEPANKKKLSNERAFKDIDSEEKSYWLGYFSADGCISTDNKGWIYGVFRVAPQDLREQIKQKYSVYSYFW